MSNWNRAYSAPHGYDLRAPYNVPMGEIQQLTVVRPFSIRSYQQNTVVEGFRGKAPTDKGQDTYIGFPDSRPPSEYIQAIKGPGNNQYCYSWMEARQPCSYRDVQLAKLYMKGYPRIK